MSHGGALAHGEITLCEPGGMEWTLRLVGIGTDGHSRSFEGMAISRPDGLGGIANSGKNTVADIIKRHRPRCLCQTKGLGGNKRFEWITLPPRVMARPPTT
jgi:hypothetical protein